MGATHVDPMKLEAAILVALRNSDRNGFAFSGALTGEDLAAAVGTPAALLGGLLERMRCRGLIDYYVADAEVSVVWITASAWSVVEPLSA